MIKNMILLTRLFSGNIWNFKISLVDFGFNTECLVLLKCCLWRRLNQIDSGKPTTCVIPYVC